MASSEEIMREQDSVVAFVTEVRAHMLTVTRQLDVILSTINGKAARHNADLETVRAEVAELRAFVEKIETEAHEAMEGMMSPDKMMEMAGKFMGLQP